MFQGEDAKHVAAIDQLYRDQAFRPPSIDDVCDHVGLGRAQVDKLLKRLQEHQRLVRVEGGILFHCEAVDAARDLLIEYIRKEGRLESVKFKYLLETSRKFAIPLLDHLDSLGITRRDGHTRLLKES